MIFRGVLSRIVEELGVELLRPVSEAGLIANYFFSAAEVAALNSRPPKLRDLASLNCWTRKEAFIKEAFTKARGGGVTYRLRT